MLTSYATCEARGSTGRLCVARPQPWGTPVAPRVAARPTPVRHTPLWYIFVCSVFAARCWWPIVDQPTVRAQLLKGQRPQAHTQAMGQARAPRARVLRLRAPIFSFQSLCWRSQGRKRHVFVESSPRDACHLLQRRTLPQTSFPRTKPHSNNYPGHLRGKTKHAQPRCPVHQVACASQCHIHFVHCCLPGGCQNVSAQRINAQAPLSEVSRAGELARDRGRSVQEPSTISAAADRGTRATAGQVPSPVAAAAPGLSPGRQ